MSDVLNPAAWNRFSYVNGNPVNLTDPSGHCAVCVPLLFIAEGVLGGELVYAGYLGYTGQQANAADLANWMIRGGAVGATVYMTVATLYMAPAIVGSGMSAAGMGAIGTAVWLDRIGISAYGLMQAGQWSYAWGTVLEYGGWAVVGIALLPKYRGVSEAQAAGGNMKWLRLTGWRSQPASS